MFPFLSILFCLTNFLFSHSLYWKFIPSGKSFRFFNKKFIIDKNHKSVFYDVCIHRKASLSKGRILENGCVICPYHGWKYYNNNTVIVPGTTRPIRYKPFFEFDYFFQNETLYISPTQLLKQQYENFTAFVPPEEHDPAFVKITGQRLIKKPCMIIMENLLDMTHISYVHSFGNPRSPIPFHIDYHDLEENVAGRTTFHYTSGQNTISRWLGNADTVVVENEFHLPDTTVTRVRANDVVKTIVTHCFPVNDNETILQYELYRNFLVSPYLDYLFQYQMKVTLDEDVKILNTIDLHENSMNYNCNYDITQMKFRKYYDKWI